MIVINTFVYSFVAVLIPYSPTPCFPSSPILKQKPNNPIYCTTQISPKSTVPHTYFHERRAASPSLHLSDSNMNSRAAGNEGY